MLQEYVGQSTHSSTIKRRGPDQTLGDSAASAILAAMFAVSTISHAWQFLLVVALSRGPLYRTNVNHITGPCDN